MKYTFDTAVKTMDGRVSGSAAQGAPEIVYRVGKQKYDKLPMDIGFEDEKLARLCNNRRLADRRLGRNGAKRLRSRLADLKAASVVTELVAGSPHPLTGDRLGQFSLRLHGGNRLVFQPAQDPVPVLCDGGIDWSSVTAVVVVEIGDYH